MKKEFLVASCYGVALVSAYNAKFLQVVIFLEVYGSVVSIGGQKHEVIQPKVVVFLFVGSLIEFYHESFLACLIFDPYSLLFLDVRDWSWNTEIS